MEEALDPRRPVVCVDELSKTLHAHVRSPHPPRAGRVAHQDYAYQRRGHRNLFLMTAPCLAWRTVKMTAHRKRQDFAATLKDQVDVHFPAAERITLVCANLNIHKPRVLCERYGPATAGRIRQKLQWVHTSKHASWLHVAEVENSNLIRQCLQRRIPDTDTLVRERAAWCRRRNQCASPVQWRFANAHAQIKLRKLYPTM